MEKEDDDRSSPSTAGGFGVGGKALAAMCERALCLMDSLDAFAVANLIWATVTLNLLDGASEAEEEDGAGRAPEGAGARQEARRCMVYRALQLKLRLGKWPG